MNILFVSAPFGPFFAEIAAALENQGCRVWRLVGEGGEWWDTPGRHRIVLRSKSSWTARLSDILIARRIDALVTFNDTSPRNRAALAIARARGLKCWVLENGYLRPHFVTLERDGVNGHSGLPKVPEFYLDWARAYGPRSSETAQFPAGLRPHVVNTIIHYVATVGMSPFLPFDRFYHGDSIFCQARGYVREYLFRATHRATREQRRLEYLRKCNKKSISVVLLQKPGDGQIRYHSPFTSNVDYLDHVMRSFAAAAPGGAHLVVKQHPLDYGVDRLPDVFARLSRDLGLEERATYVRQTSIEHVLDVATTVVTMNSTAGLAAVQRAIPTICLGSAFYDLEGLTYQGALDDFWSRPSPPDGRVVAAFVAYLRETNQINGGFHTREGRELLVRSLVPLLGGWRVDAEVGAGRSGHGLGSAPVHGGALRFD